MDDQYYFSQIPRDIQRIIFLKTEPRDLDTLCNSNTEISQLCFNKKLLDEYLNIYNLNFRPHKLHKITETNSSILIAHVINQLRKSNIQWEMIFMDLIHNYILQQDGKDENIVEVLDILHNQENFILQEQTVVELARYAIERNRDMVLNWLFDNYDINYSLLVVELLNHRYVPPLAKDYANKLLDIIIEENINVDWPAIIEIILSNFHFDIFDKIMSSNIIDKNLAIKYLRDTIDNVAEGRYIYPYCRTYSEDMEKLIEKLKELEEL